MVDFVIICAIGRSGSTTIQRIINIIPNTNICGENNRAIINLLEFYYNIKYEHIKHYENKNYEYFVTNNLKPCWYNSFNREEIILQLKSLINNLFMVEGSETIGFKEIRFNGDNIHLIHELREMFPSLKVIIHIREDVDKQSISDWWKKDDKSKEIINDLNNLLIDFHNKNKDFTFLSTFDNMFKLEKVKDIFVFLNKEKWFDSEKINHILDNNIPD
jgi:hypothetical protein